ncbi:13237_t:CDS:2 [Racocetra persica]|uniref:13237_t:CDS:1 n=1 Tax=Racocetra persica TaxID=160502 RepID=A0ACA9QTE6_9GLOM|nr:13237_t:CDS:2 [Racocetra persica]
MGHSECWWNTNIEEEMSRINPECFYLWPTMTVIQRMYEIDHDLPEAREQALRQILETQEKQKERHD